MNININADVSDVIAHVVIKTINYFGLKPTNEELEKLTQEIINSKEINEALKNMTKIN